MKNVFLTGFMGCGKSRVARCLSAWYGAPCLETDQMVEQQAGCSVRELFETKGEAFFRQLEREVLHNIPDYAVVATGGGLPCQGDNMDWMLSQGHVFYLQVPAGLLAQRLDTPSSRARRPLLPPEKDLSDYVRTTLAAREPFYLRADHIIDAGVRPTPEVVREIAGIISTLP